MKLLLVILLFLLCCVGTGYCAECGNKQCNSWTWLLYDYVFDTDNCRSQGNSYWLITLVLSVIPLPGLNNLYTGKMIDGVFELIHGGSSYALSEALDDISRGRRIDDGFGAATILFALVMDGAKITYMYYNEVEAMKDLVVIIPLTVIAVIVGALSSNHKSCGVAVALGLMAPTAIIKWLEHLLMTLLNAEVDVNECALVSIFELFK